MPRSRFRLSLRFAWTASLVVAALLVLHLLASPSVADDFARQAARAAVQRYLRELDEIEKVAAERRAEATRRLRKALSESEKFSQKENGKRYRGMLGRYIAHTGPIPFIMLNVPNGDNV